MNSLNLSLLSDEVLLLETKSAAAREREMTLLVLRHIREVDRRKLYATLKYSTLYAYVTQELGYDGSSAMRRINAMMLLGDFPDVEKKIEIGTFNLSTAAAAQSFFRKEPVAPEKKKEILAAIEGKSTLKVEKTLLSFSANPVSHLREKRIKAVTPELSEVHFFANDELLDQLEKLKGLLAHSHPNMTTGELVAYLARMGLERLDPAARKVRVRKVRENKATTSAPNNTPCQNERASEKWIPSHDMAHDPAPKSEVKPSKPALSSTSSRRRRPPAANVRAAWKRDDGRCVWRGSKTGKICGSRYRVQTDHIIPWAFGGDHSVENLRCLCFRHNQLEAERWFGKGSRRTHRCIERSIKISNGKDHSF